MLVFYRDQNNTKSDKLIICSYTLNNILHLVVVSVGIDFVNWANCITFGNCSQNDKWLWKAFRGVIAEDKR